MCLDYKAWNFTRYVHNAYLFIGADLGLLGLLPFLWFSVSYLFRGFSMGRRLKDPVLKGWVLGLTLGYIALLVASMAGPEFMAWHTVPIIAVMLAANEVAIRLEESPA
jgi:O-antigen ligase